MTTKTQGKIWSCKIGGCDDFALPSGADMPMRNAVSRAYQLITGLDPQFIFSGWGAELTECELALLENRLPIQPTPDPDKIICPNCAHQFHAIPVNIQ